MTGLYLVFFIKSGCVLSGTTSADGEPFVNPLVNPHGFTEHMESTMGSTTDKIKGVTNEAIGKAKQGIGEAVDSPKLQGEGAIQEAKGEGQKAVGDAKEATKDAVNKAAELANKKL